MIYEGEVKSIADLSKQGHMLVYCPEISETLVTVVYVTPFKGGMNGAFIAIPLEGETIVFSKSSSGKNYYMGCLLSDTGTKREYEDQIKDAHIIPHQDLVYGTRDRPSGVVLGDYKGNHLFLSSDYSPESVNIKAELKSHTGKKVMLSDSPLMNLIMVRNEFGDNIKLTSDETEFAAARAFEVDTMGPVGVYSRESGIHMRVVDGRELTIRNTSTGLNANPESPEKVGNVNIESMFKDVNMTVRHEDGSIFIDALGGDGLIQIDSAGRIQIAARSGSVQITAQENLILAAGGDVFLNAGGSLHMKAGADASLTSGGLASVKGSSVAINGARLDLNTPGAAQDALDPTLDNLDLNNYDD